jgi:hypothetical protein
MSSVGRLHNFSAGNSPAGRSMRSITSLPQCEAELHSALTVFDNRRPPCRFALTRGGTV